MKILLICGDRNWNDPTPIQRAVTREAPDIVIHGAARGADTLGGREAALQNIEAVAYPADWERYGRAAGPIRNTEMLRCLQESAALGHQVKVVAFHSDLANSKGTKNMVEQARKAGIEVEVIV